MQYLQRITGMIRNTVYAPPEQEWGTKPNQSTVILIGDDHLDNYVTCKPDLRETLNAKDNTSVFNCAFIGSTMNSILTNEHPSLITRISRGQYAYPNCDEFQVVEWVERADWVVFGVGHNESRDMPIELLEKQFREVMGQVLAKNKQCIVVTSKDWVAWYTMLQKVCDELQVDLLFTGPDVAEHIYTLTKTKTKIPKYVSADAIISPPSLPH